MKRQIRRGVFETNSSSTHSITMCIKSEYDRWCIGKTYLYTGYGYGFSDDFKPKENNFYTYDECIEFLKHNKYVVDENTNELLEDLDIDTALSEYGFMHADDENDYEWFNETYETPSGEVVVAFGYYGYDC